MNASTHEPLNLAGEELSLVTAMLESAHARLLIEIRHTDRRAFRDELRHRLSVLEGLMERCQLAVSPEGAAATPHS